MDLKEKDIVIFRNTKKQEGTRQPDCTGKLMFNGIIKDVSLWVSESKAGNKFFSGKIKDEWQPNQQQDPKAINKDFDKPFDDGTPPF